VDPKQALLDAQKHLRTGELDEAVACLADYRAWRRGGGFEPTGGDQLACDLERRLAAAVPGTIRERTTEEDPTTPSGDAARVLYLRQFRAAFEQAAGKPLPEGFEDTEVEAYRQRGVPAAEAARDFLQTYWQGGLLLP
jgi:hypothetical protein